MIIKKLNYSTKNEISKVRKPLLAESVWFYSISVEFINCTFKRPMTRLDKINRVLLIMGMP